MSSKDTNQQHQPIRDQHSRNAEDTPGTNPCGPCLGRSSSQPRVIAGEVIISPDGGWGWMVVIASFMAHLIADGCSLSFGVLFTELLEVFEESKSKTAWVGSVFISMPLICGPFASMFVSRYGCRWATVLGGLLASVGCIASSFVNSIDALCITFGLVSGFGLALVFIPAVLVVAFYFKRRRSLATGIAVAGSGIGTFIFAPLTDWLIQEYSWRGSFIVIGGLMLNFVVCGAIYRPLPQPCRNSETFVISDLLSQDMILNKRISYLSSRGSLDEEEDWKESDPFSVFREPQRSSMRSQISEPLTQSLVQLPTFLDEEADDPESKMLLRLKLRYHRLLSEGHGASKAEEDDAIQSSGQRVISCDSGVTAMEKSSSADKIDASVMIVMERDKQKVNETEEGCGPLMLTGELLHLCRSDVLCQRGLIRARFLLARGQMSSCPDIYIQSTKKQGFRDRLKDLLFPRRLFAMINDTFDVSIFKSTIFNYFCLHNMLLYMSYNNPYIYLPDKAAQHGISDDSASTLVAIIGISSTVGQVVMGFIGDQPKIDTILFYNVMTSVAGIITLLVPVLTSFPLLALYSASYGFFISANYALTSIILVDLLGMEQLTSSFGVVSSAGGFAVLVGPPLAGWISDQTGSYEPTFYISGMIILVSGCMLFAVPCLRHRRSCSDETTVTTTATVSSETATSEKLSCTESLSLPCESPKRVSAVQG